MYQFNQFAGAGSGGTALLTLESALRRPLPTRSFGSKAASRTLDLDLVTDLGVRIGSKEWFRGFAVCAGLCYAAWCFGPGFEPIPGAAAAPISEVQLDEFRALSISPLAYGADTGRRMAPGEKVEPLLDTPERPVLNLVASLGRGDGFARALERAGVAEHEADHVADLIAAAVPLGDIQPGTSLDLTLGRRPDRSVARPLEGLSFRARFDLKLSVTRVGDALTVTRTPIAIDNTPLRIQGYVGSSLYRSARAAGVPAKAVESYIRAVATQTGIGGLGAADRFDIILEHRRAATGETETGQLLYAGLDRSGGKDLQLMQWDQGGRTQWFEASGAGRQSGVLQRPVPGTVSSNFGMRRHPILGYSRMHKGMDFRAGYGTPILAVTDGRVAAAGWAGGYGNQVRLAHSGGIMTSYSHMSRIVVRPGATIRQGQVIGYAGSTGLSTGPHLHYELYKNGVPVNPASVKFATRAQLSGEDLAGFRQRLRNLLAVRAGGGTTQVADTATKKPKA
ncbi:MAG TPA: peptidoglycan DD-metalloendopeptidase family protein [Allosphingosinicella sp.]